MPFVDLICCQLAWNGIMNNQLSGFLVVMVLIFPNLDFFWLLIHLISKLEIQVGIALASVTILNPIHFAPSLILFDLGSYEMARFCLCFKSPGLFVR